MSNAVKVGFKRCPKVIYPDREYSITLSSSLRRPCLMDGNLAPKIFGNLVTI